jgi:hypothetical protein
VQLTSGWTPAEDPRRHRHALADPKRDRRKVSFLSIDVTEKVMGAAQAAIESKLVTDARWPFDLPHEASGSARSVSPLGWATASGWHDPPGSGSACSGCRAIPWSPRSAFRANPA